MNWKKRECPIRMEIVPYGAGWEDITLDICGDHHWWSVSGCLGDGFGALVESLYALYPHQPHEGKESRWLTESEAFVADFKDGQYTNIRLATKEDGSYYSFPKTAGFYWDLEGTDVTWKLTRESGPQKEFSLEIDLDESGKKPLHYEVRYADFCYAVGKALTEALKAHGFAGFNAAVWESDVNVRLLCFLKACGLGMPEAIQPIESAERGKGEKSSLADELELLLFDM